MTGKLTNDDLVIDENGKVSIVGCNDSGKCLDNGTNLVSDLINSDKTITITQSKEGNGTIPADESGAVDPEKGSDSTVYYNPDKTRGGVDEEGSNKRPAEIGLAHELGHAQDMANGTEPPSNQYSDNIEPYKDLPLDERNPNYYHLLKERESKIRVNVENPIRKEQGLKKRKIVNKKKFQHYGHY